MQYNMLHIFSDVIRLRYSVNTWSNTSEVSAEVEMEELLYRKQTQVRCISCEHLTAIRGAF